MKIKHGIIIFVILFIGLIILGQGYLPIDFQLQQMLTEIIGFLSLVNLSLIVYLILRNIFRAIKGAVTGVPQGDGYRTEARKACEKVTPKRKQDVTPPWEE